MIKNKKYDTDDNCRCERNDDRYSGTVSFSRNMFYDWLDVAAEYAYTKRDSNYVNKNYERNKTTVSLTAEF